MIWTHLSGSAPCMKVYGGVALGAAFTVLALYLCVCRENEGHAVFLFSPSAAVTVPAV